MTGLAVQVCGVFLVLITGAASGMDWGLQCYPWLCRGFIASYTLAAAMCVIVGKNHGISCHCRCFVEGVFVECALLSVGTTIRVVDCLPFHPPIISKLNCKN